MAGRGGGQERECHPMRVAPVVILWVFAFLVSVVPVPARPPNSLFILVDCLAATLLDTVRQRRAKLAQSRNRIVSENLSGDV